MQFSTTLHRMVEVGNDSRVIFIKTSYNPPEKHTLLDEVRRIFSIFRAAQGQSALLLNALSGRFHPDLLAIIMIGFLPRKKRPLIALAGAMWQPDSGLRGLFDRLVVKTADRVVNRYVVQSTEETESFPNFWNIDKSKVRLSPYFYSLTEEEVNRPVEVDSGYVFAGGNSHRNYQPLIEVARQMPGTKFIIASHSLNGRSDLPPNLKTGNVSHTEFVDLMKSASIVVTPIVKGLVRASGQQTYLNAMLLGKPSVVSESFGVKDHIEDRKTGLIVSGSTESYLQALSWLLDPKNRADVQKMTDAARRVVTEKFSKEKHVSRLMDIMEELLSEFETDDKH